MSKYTKEEIEQKKQFIKKYFRRVANGNAKTVASVKHVSASGMMRVISFTGYYVSKGKLYSINLTHYIEAINGYTIDRNTYGVRVGGCGMDMIFNTLYNLFQATHDEKFKRTHHYGSYTHYDTM